MVQKVFMGWRRPLLASAAEWLANRFRTNEIGLGIDLQHVLLVVPGRRFGRELIAELVDIGEKSESWISPGRVSTPGEVGGALLGGDARKASPVVRALAWAGALRVLPPEEFEKIFRRRPADDAMAEWARLGGMLDSTVGELARELILPTEVPERCRELAQMGDAGKWEIIDRCRRGYESILAEARLIDGNLSNLSTLRAAANRAEPKFREIVLVGVVELDRASRSAIEQSGLRTSALVFGPDSENRWTDEFGCVRHEITRPLVSVIGSAIEIAEDTRDCADRVAGRIAAWTQQHRGLVSREVSVCAPDSKYAHELALAARDVHGLRFHDAAGKEIGRTSAVKLLGAACEHLRQRTLESLASILKRPEIEKWVTRSAKQRPDWIARVDAAAVLNPGVPDGSPPEELRGVAESVSSLFGDLAAQGQTPCGADRAFDMSIDFLGRALADDEPADGEIEALKLIADAIAEIRDGAAMIGELVAWRWIELLLEAIRSERLAAASRRDEIELLGWLEAACDRAPFVVITGLNEGAIPVGRVEDPLLPEPVRAALGMPTGSSRAERDAFLLEGLVRSRMSDSESRGEVWCICAKRDAQGNPLKPSRLLFRCDDDEAIERVERLSNEIPEPPRFEAVKRRLPKETARASDIGFPVAPLHDVAIPSAVRVTAFREYLRSPYVFFLKHVAGLAEVHDPDAEADSSVMGTLLHRILREFGAGEARSERREAAISEWVLARFERALAEVPKQAISGVRDIQIEVARRRLRTFARLQAAHAKDGWSIFETEWESPTPVAINAPSGKLLLTARLDRIDKRHNELLILDYKTADAAKAPGETHFKSKQWIDLQLPLYLYLLRKCGLAPEGARAGYFLLPKKSAEGRIVYAEWTGDQLSDAEAIAARVVDDVLNHKFEHGEDPFEDGAIARLCGVTLLEIDSEETEE